MNEKQGKIIDVKETGNYVVVTVQGLFGIDVKILPKPRTKIKWDRYGVPQALGCREAGKTAFCTGARSAAGEEGWETRHG
ncbi:MAG: hypothetical protein DRP12_00255 [Candidatus Aenigmatarchaeota archaeon]|nr:MAG: hypothetical protein DRP12_00255 [Candidatus Aenigmarchaeota archaeon]